MEVTELGIVRLVKPEQPRNAVDPIEVTEFGIVSDPVKPLQLANAPFPIVITEFGIVNDPVKEQLSKALSAIEVKVGSKEISPEQQAEEGVLASIQPVVKEEIKEGKTRKKTQTKNIDKFG